MNVFFSCTLKPPDTIKWCSGIAAACGFEALLIACSDTSRDRLGRGQGVGS